jgi:hypothetical protein
MPSGCARIPTSSIFITTSSLTESESRSVLGGGEWANLGSREIHASAGGGGG